MLHIRYDNKVVRRISSRANQHLLKLQNTCEDVDTDYFISISSREKKISSIIEFFQGGCVLILSKANIHIVSSYISTKRKKIHTILKILFHVILCYNR